jgi:hypothetical protein
MAREAKSDKELAMIRSKDVNVGRFSVEVELANNDDIARANAGDIPPIPDAQATRPQVDHLGNRAKAIRRRAGILPP